MLFSRLMVLLCLITGSLPLHATEVTRHEDRMSLDAAREAMQNPKEFELAVPDITKIGEVGAMTIDMAKFYFVMAMMDFTHCFQSNDPTPCQAFIESLKDPVGHLGFALFMKANRWTVDLSQIVTRGKISPSMAGYLGLAGGMMARSIFQDIYYHPDVQRFFAVSRIKDPEKRDEARRKAMNKIWKTFKSGAGGYLFNKIPNVMGLLGAAVLSKATMTAAGKVLGTGGKAVEFALGKGKRATAVVKYGKDLKKEYSLAKAGIKFVIKGGKILRINPVFAIGSYIVETAVFLAWAPVVEGWLVPTWKRGKIVTNINRLRNKLDKVLFVRNPDVKLAKYYTDQLAGEYDKWRESILWEVERTKGQHLHQISKIDQSFEKKLMYYEWLIRGMDQEDELWKMNQFSFHHHKNLDAILEYNDMAESLFCGVDSWKAVTRKIDWHGITLPGKQSFNHVYDPNQTAWWNAQKNKPSRGQTSGVIIDPWRINSAYGVCMSDMLALNGGKRPAKYDDTWCPVRINRSYGYPEYGKFMSKELHCRVDMAYARRWILKNGKYKTRDIREFLSERLDTTAGKVMQKAWTQRDLMVLRFEKVIRKNFSRPSPGGKTSRSEPTP